MRNRLCGSSKQTNEFESTHVIDKEDGIAGIVGKQDHQLCLFGPERYEARYEYPLIVWLHSCGSSEFELESVMPTLSLQNYVACAPRGTSACDPEGKLFRWSQSAAASAIAEEVIFESIEYVQSQFSINRRKIFLAGFGGGGTMAWRIAMRYPQRFAGTISICGDFPKQQTPLTNLSAVRSLPAMWMFGAQSDRCGIEHVCRALPLLHSAGLSVDIRQYQCGTELLSNMLTDLNHWIMGHVTQQVSSPTPLAGATTFSQN